VLVKRHTVHTKRGRRTHIDTKEWIVSENHQDDLKTDFNNLADERISQLILSKKVCLHPVQLQQKQKMCASNPKKKKQYATKETKSREPESKLATDDTTSQLIDEYVGKTILTKSREAPVSTAEAIKGKSLIGFYFAASWYVPGQGRGGERGDVQHHSHNESACLHDRDFISIE